MSAIAPGPPAVDGVALFALFAAWATVAYWLTEAALIIAGRRA